ncbi:hypothetical protein QBC39DRAFT_399942 [Podospora conica]|nr:hypothetical protein QBC39DRAFT_399942 [Schizothecium conicum]
MILLVIIILSLIHFPRQAHRRTKDKEDTFEAEDQATGDSPTDKRAKAATTDIMDGITTSETVRPPFPERQFPQMAPLPPRPVSKGGGAYGHHLRPRRCLTFGWSAYNPRRVHGVGEGFRCFTIWYLTLVRLVALMIDVWMGSFGHPWIAGFILGSILGLVSFHFVSLSLAFIYQARGERRCMGMRWNRRTFDGLLGFIVAVQSLQVIGEFLFIPIGSPTSSSLWTIVGIMIVSLGVIAAREPDGCGRGEEEGRIGM